MKMHWVLKGPECILGCLGYLTPPREDTPPSRELLRLSRGVITYLWVDLTMLELLSWVLVLEAEEMAWVGSDSLFFKEVLLLVGVTFCFLSSLISWSILKDICLNCYDNSWRFLLSPSSAFWADWWT